MLVAMAPVAPRSPVAAVAALGQMVLLMVALEVQVLLLAHQ
jgi:hypothetical protein